MTKKQFGIIFTLMALIVCVGVLSMKLNESGLTDPANLDGILSMNENEPDDTETLSTTDFFYNLRAEKEQRDAKFIDELKALKEDTNVAQDQKDIANNSLIQKTQTKELEGRVEQNIKNKGYEDVLCMIDQGKVNVYVKVKENPTQEESAMIQQIVEDITTLKEITIETKK